MRVVGWMRYGSKLKPRDSRPAQSQSQVRVRLSVRLAVCGAEIGFDSPRTRPQQGISCEIRKRFGVARIYLYLWMYFHTDILCSQQFASLAPEGRNDGWEGRTRADGVVGPNGPKASLYPTGA